MKSSLADIQQKAIDYAAIINAPQELLPTYENSRDEFVPNIALDTNGQLRYEIYERGQLITNEFATDEDDLLYYIFRDISFSMAVRYEVHNRNPRQDWRRMLFAKQAELLGQLSPAWKQRVEKEKEAILKTHPFDDNSTQRLDLFDKLMKAGKTYEQAMSEANKKFPNRNPWIS